MPGRAQRKHYHILGDFILQETAVWSSWPGEKDPVKLAWNVVE